MTNDLDVNSARIAAAAVFLLCGCATEATAPSTKVQMAPRSLPRIGTVDERYQSYNIEMLEVTGGKFWKPYGPELDALLAKGQQPTAANASGDTPAGMNPAVYGYRPPLDLTHPRLRKLAAALGPGYVRSSGTWANTSYFADSEPPPAMPPAGFSGVLTRAQWKGLVDFSQAVDAFIVTSFATSPGARNSDGVWNTEQAERFLAYTRSVDGRIAAAEFMNEPTFAAMGGAPRGYGATAYGRDFRVFHSFARRVAPDMLILGPGSVGEADAPWAVGYGGTTMLKTRDLLIAAGQGVDAFSYHHYGAASQRCAPMSQTTPDAALSEEWLARTDLTLSFYRRARDELEPGKPFWVTETADAACGGNPWAATFLDTFRYLDQLGRLARQGVRVVAHNTLVASDYGLLDENTFAPKPNYWGALLWRRLMGTTVLDSEIPIAAGLHVYAHCERGVSGGVSLLIINTSMAVGRTLDLTSPSQRYTLSASGDLQGRSVRLNDRALKLEGDDLPQMAGTSIPAGDVDFAPSTITFLAIPDAENAACR